MDHGGGFVLYKGVASLLLPPGLLVVVLIFLGLRAFRPPQRRGLGAALLVLALGIYGMSIPLGARVLLGTLEAPWTPEIPPADRRWGVLVLAGGVFVGEDGRAELNAYTLGRLVGGWEVARQRNWPLLVSGGVSLEAPESPSLGALMEERLRRWGYTGTVWREERSRNTWENLEESKRIVISEDLEGVLLVTDAFHMSRSLAMARRSLPVAVWPYAVGFLVDQRPLTYWDFFPGYGSLQNCIFGLREYLGMVAYELYGFLFSSPNS